MSVTHINGLDNVTRKGGSLEIDAFCGNSLLFCRQAVRERETEKTGRSWLLPLIISHKRITIIGFISSIGGIATTLDGESSLQNLPLKLT